MQARTVYTMLGLSVLMCGAAFGGAPLSAQSSDLPVGSVARVSATTLALNHVVGRVVAVTADSLTLENENYGGRFSIPRSALTSTERQLPDASRAVHTFAGAGLGLLGGAAIGGVAGAASARSCPSGRPDDFCGSGFGATLGAMGGGFLGLVLGTVIGLASPVDRWSRVENLQVSVTPNVVATHPGLSIALRF